MKNINAILKRTVFLFFFLGLMMEITSAYAQREAMTNDLYVGSMDEVINTGTDVIEGVSSEIGTGLLQVMVSDGDPESRLYWKVIVNPSTIYSNYLAIDPVEANVVDPDVVLQYYDGNYYAFTVYIKSNKQVGWRSYVFNGLDFQYLTSGVLGKGEAIPFSGNSAIDYYGCSNPNVDVNALGKVAITWAESYKYTEQIQVENTVLDIDFTEESEIERGEVFAAYGFINGAKASGSSFTTISGRNREAGDRISHFSGSLADKSSVPDVAIGDNDAEENGPTVTYAYSRESSSGKELIGQQEGWHTATIDAVPEIQTNASIASRPRIASRKSSTYPKDFEIVTSFVQTNPGCDNGSGGVIVNYGKRNHAIHNVSEVNSDMKTMANFDPVVTYDANLQSSDFIVTWTTNAQCGPAIDNGLNVVSRTMYHSGSNTLPKYDNYSFVNKGNFNMPYGDTRGDQSIPSIAGRYLSNGTAYFFYDWELSYLLSKHSTLLDGQNNLRSTSGLVSSPNPFKDNTLFKINVDSDDIIKEILIYDVAGKVVETIKPNGKTGSQEITWKPNQKLISGIYLAKVLTNKETKTIKIIRSN